MLDLLGLDIYKNKGTTNIKFFIFEFETRKKLFTLFEFIFNCGNFKKTININKHVIKF